MRVLLVEDETDLAQSILDYLKNTQKFNCDVAHNLEKATELCVLYEYDCLIIDIGLPDGNGLDLIESSKANHNKTGIIIISARDAIEDRIKGLNLGADDYLVKPFHLSELNARIYSLVRRLRFDGSSVFVVNEIALDPQSREVKINGKAIELTKSEYDILYYFMSNKNQVISKTSLAESLVGEYVDILNSLDFVYLHIKNLRKKLTAAGCTDYIKTVYGVGYKFQVE
ncbi:MAG: response regulator transcription factor [Salinivirgaceae bacterium]